MTLTLTLIAISALALIVGALTFWVNFRAYGLEKASRESTPGLQVSPAEVAKVLDDVEEDPVRAIAARHVFAIAEKKPVGYIIKQPIGVYLDLHTASCVPRNRAILSESLCKFIRAESPTLRTDGLYVATPREGNLILGAKVAEDLHADYLMIRTGRAPRFGYPIEGAFVPGSRAILVDDLCMEGEFLTRCVKHLRNYGLNISDCFCLFERLDGDAREALTAASVTLHSRYQIDDDELEQLQATAHAAEARSPVSPSGQSPRHS